ncbi:MAG TPA: hypothetical protein VFV05_03590 [Methylomirabilota bacterium]|nr:hypothetical protein [Methylomirabilota bacterium]
MGPRLFGIPAARAPVVAVLRRGPSAWSHVGRWDVARGVYEPGAWIRGHLYPQRCDVSPDGRWLCYFTLKASARWPAGRTYVAISRLPWLTALAAWSTCGTWTRGLHFVDDPGVWQVGAPDAGDATPCRKAVGVAFTPPVVFAVERRRGWTETADSPPRDAGDMWDEERAPRVSMEKPRPGAGGSSRLIVQGHFAAFREGEPGPIAYAVVEDGRVAPLDDVQWADWDGAGRLLAATVDGKLQIRDGPMTPGAVLSEVDLAALHPQPAPPPEEARRW